MICTKCQVEMEGGIARMGVTVKFVRKDGSFYFRRGDEVACPECGATVVTSFGESFEDPKTEKYAKYTVKA